MNKDKRNNIKLLGTLNNADESGIIANASQIYDDVQQKAQETINSELIAAVGTEGSVDTRITNAVNVEKTRAEGAESTLDGKIAAEQTRAANAENALDGRVDTLEEAVGTGGSVDSRIASAVATETSRAQEAEANRYTKNETYTKEEVNNLITTPNQEYVSVTATDQTTAVTDVLPAIGLADTIYRVGNWDGSQYDVTKYSEYAWNSRDYVHLSTKTQIGEVFDISAYHATGGTLATYDDLEDALGTNGANVPQSLRKGGMSIKFVRTSDNKYVQYRLRHTNWTTDVAYWVNIEEILNNQITDIKNNIATVSDGPGDFSIQDEAGNILCLWKDGHIKTKNFLSSTLNQVIFDSTDQTTNNANYGTIEDLDKALTPGVFLWKQNGKQVGIVQCFLDNLNHALTQILCTNFQLTDTDNNVLNFTDIADKDYAKKGTFSSHQHTMHTYVRTYGYTDDFADNQSSAQKLEKGWSGWVGLLLDSEWYSNLKLICQSWFKDFSNIIIDDCQDDFSIQDEEGNILCLWKDGHIKTKNFDSSKIASIVTTSDGKRMLKIN